MKHVSELGRSFYEFHARCPRCGASFGKASFTELVMGLIPLERYSTSMLSTFFKTLKTAGFCEIYGRSCLRLISRARESNRLAAGKDGFDIAKDVHC